MRELVQLMIDPTAAVNDRIKRQIFFDHAKEYTDLHVQLLTEQFICSYRANKSVIDESTQLYWCTADLSTTGVYTDAILGTKCMTSLMRDLSKGIATTLQEQGINVESVKVRPVPYRSIKTTHLFASVRFHL